MYNKSFFQSYGRNSQKSLEHVEFNLRRLGRQFHYDNITYILLQQTRTLYTPSMITISNH